MVHGFLTKGEFYNGVTSKRNDSDELKGCVEEVVGKLLTNDTNIDNPGMLLGKIQSGKTRAFIGAIALSFDNGYDMAIILTKGTKALALQTYSRIVNDFSEFKEDDQLQVFDIMHVPENLTSFELQQKLIMIVKKETNNLRRVIKALEKTYPDLSYKKLLIIDDEADYASIGFKSDSTDGSVQATKIPSQINELRNKVKSSNYLQVTATPYSLYLQPENINLDSENYVFKPIRPAFTVLLPTFDGYIGGDEYFNKSNDIGSIFHHVYEAVPTDELDILRKEDRRSFKIEDVLVSPRVSILRKAIMNFITGACIRRFQQKENRKQKKYSFIVHTERARRAHSWQENIVNTMVTSLRENLAKNRKLITDLIEESYNDLKKSISILEIGNPKIKLPDLQTVIEEVIKALEAGHLMVTKVNTDRETEQLLDEKGQLKLRTPLNIFIGGQILDRGITIENLIGFYYGRRPSKFQQDTVLQHSRMYGNRYIEDLAVTRFYTARVIYEAMKRINEFDSALREAFERNAQDAGVVFIHLDPCNEIRPCSPNKILLSTTTTLRPFRRMLPVGFQTDYKTNIRRTLEFIDGRISRVEEVTKDGNPFLVDLDFGLSIIDSINSMFKYDEGYEWDYKAYKACMEYLSKNTENPEEKGEIWMLIRTGRNASRLKQDGTFYDAPDTASAEGEIARKTAINIPMLMLFRQNGNKEQGWMDSPFWWPVLVAPRRLETVIFASDLVEQN